MAETNFDAVAGALNSNINNSFASGEITSGTLAANDSTELTINFGKTLKSVPVVVANIYQNVSDNSIYIIQVSDITTTGAKITIRCNRNSVSLSANRKVAWVAVCI